MNIKLQSITPNLMVENIDETIAYYEEVFGFTLLRTVPDKGELDWAMMKRNEVVLMFQTKRSLASEIPALQSRKPGSGTTLYIKMKGVEKLFEEIENKTEIVAELEHTFYDTREFSVMDLNGYVITFAEDVEE